MTPGIDIAESGMELRDLQSDREFRERRLPARSEDRQFEALNKLARTFVAAPELVLQSLVEIAVEFCSADSAGISLEELEQHREPRFRWIAIAGSFQRYLDGTTPRYYSPCGTCLDTGRPQLYRVTKPYYDFLGVTADPITDGILIPWESGTSRGTLWAVAHGSREAFSWEDYRLLDALADFAAIVIRYQAQEEALRLQAREQASATRAHQLAHQINNPLQSLTNTLYLASHGGADTQSFISQAQQELQALSGLVRKILEEEAAAQDSSLHAIDSLG